jgi:hypothetical protein
VCSCSASRLPRCDFSNVERYSARETDTAATMVRADKIKTVILPDQPYEGLEDRRKEKLAWEHSTVERNGLDGGYRFLRNWPEEFCAGKTNKYIYGSVCSIQEMQQLKICLLC